jgi:hypothetical protein
LSAHTLEAAGELDVIEDIDALPFLTDEEQRELVEGFAKPGGPVARMLRWLPYGSLCTSA